MSGVNRLDLRRRRVAFEVTGESRTKQSMRDECDINFIMGRYLKSGQVDHLAKHGPQYGFCTGDTFQDAMNIVVRAETMFMDLDSKIRQRFGNSPKAFLEFIQSPDNIPEMIKMGLAKRVEAEQDAPKAAMAPPAAQVAT